MSSRCAIGIDIGINTGGAVAIEEVGRKRSVVGEWYWSGWSSTATTPGLPHAASACFDWLVEQGDRWDEVIFQAEDVWYKLVKGKRGRLILANWSGIRALLRSMGVWEDRYYQLAQPFDPLLEPATVYRMRAPVLWVDWAPSMCGLRGGELKEATSSPYLDARLKSEGLDWEPINEHTRDGALMALWTLTRDALDRMVGNDGTQRVSQAFGGRSGGSGGWNGRGRKGVRRRR